MLNEYFTILLNEKSIGATAFEKTDVSMGVVFGEIKFTDVKSGYAFFKEYCLMNNIVFEEYPDDKLISTRNIPNLKVTDKNSVEIKGLSCSISGMDSDGFEITIEGIPNEIFELNFPHHINRYRDFQ
ncbi:hypothetical protein I5M27_15075 [Adhaeribacter sp. BT258]|uniref:Uncharacterized protein n=1 Tax=Adhaeribacter terrigena TaxID=2793070 RepID=A0ABS1C4S4_9BACT|nr:hypothetical protein [Adhaeribacter terrigena]MBK0404318.1 hypothetical protein [Adhaeribacter terrigena]